MVLFRYIQYPSRSLISIIDDAEIVTNCLYYIPLRTIVTTKSSISLSISPHVPACTFYGPKRLILLVKNASTGTGIYWTLKTTRSRVICLSFRVTERAIFEESSGGKILYHRRLKFESHQSNNLKCLRKTEKSKWTDKAAT